MAKPASLRVLRPEPPSYEEPTARATIARKVALVCAPFQTITLPSIALGTLAPLLRGQGHHVDVIHLNLDFAARLGVELYEELGSYTGWLRLTGEWLFASPQIAPGALSEDAYRAYLRAHQWRERAPHLERLDLAGLRAEADAAVERWFRSRDWGAYDVVGFNLMFQQLNASLRLGLRIKDRFPRTRVILGGSAMEVPMGQPVLERHEWLDAVFSGYSERTLPRYVATLPARVPRVITQPTRVDMDELPVPDFDAFFETVTSTGLEGAALFSVPIETSRGCWWGERNHCVFCGLNARDMTQRNKSGSRVFDEVVLQTRYGRPFFATDNILPLEFFDGLFDRLIDDGVPFDTFYETKSNLNLGQLQKLRRAGVSSLQPGIESLSTPILREMKKGVSAAQNVWFLRAAEELGFGVAWSILYGFPEEDPAEYEKMAALLPSLSHLPPPLRPAPVLMERFSPLFDRAASFGFRNVRPTFAHRAAFGDAPAPFDRAYVFDFDYGDGREPERYTASVNRAVKDWIAARKRVPSPRCEVLRVGSLRFVLDSRASDRVGLGWPTVRRLTDAEWHLVELTSELTDEHKLRAAWRSDEPLDALVTRFVERKWLLRSDGRLVRILMCRAEPTVTAELGRAARAGLHRGALWLRRVRVASRAVTAFGSKSGEAARPRGDISDRVATPAHDETSGVIVGPSRHLPEPLGAVARRFWDEASLFHRRFRNLLPPPAARVVAESVERVQRPRLALFRSDESTAPSVLVASNDPLLRASLFGAFTGHPRADGDSARTDSARRDGIARSAVRPDTELDADVVALEIPSRSARSFARAGWLVLPRWVALEVDLRQPEHALWDARKRETVRRIERAPLELEVARGKDAADYFHEHLYAPTARARHGALAVVVRLGHVQAAARVGHFLFVRERGVRRAGLVVVPRPGPVTAVDALLFGVIDGDYDGTRLAREALYLFALRWARDEARATQFGLTVAAPFANDGILRFKTHWGATALADPRQGVSIAVRVQRGSLELYRALTRKPPLLLRELDGNVSLAVPALRLSGSEEAAAPRIRGVTPVEVALQSPRELPRLLESLAKGD